MCDDQKRRKKIFGDEKNLSYSCDLVLFYFHLFFGGFYRPFVVGLGNFKKSNAFLKNLNYAIRTRRSGPHS